MAKPAEKPVKPKTFEARATVNLPGLPAGTTALVSGSSPYIQGLLERRFLVRV